MTVTLHIPDDASALSGDDAVQMYLLWRRRYMSGRPARISVDEVNAQLRQEPDTGTA